MRCKSVSTLRLKFRAAAFATLLASVTAFAIPLAHGTALRIEVTDARGKAVPDAVVTATAQNPSMPSPAANKPATMDQVAKAFVPGVLVVRTGQSVIFPNSDSVAHQVYSFSPAKRFELPLYRGHAHPPIVLDHPGLIVLGCNIHDSMVGYIFVTDAPYFGTSDARGHWNAGELPAANYEIGVWSARLPRDAAIVTQRVEVGEQPTVVKISLKETLRPAPSASPDPRVRDY